MKRTIELNREAFPDMRLIVEDQVAEGDKVVTRWRGEMTHAGQLGGLAPPATASRSRVSRLTASRTAKSLKHGAAWTRLLCSEASAPSEEGAMRSRPSYRSSRSGEPKRRRPDLSADAPERARRCVCCIGSASLSVHLPEGGLAALDAAYYGAGPTPRLTSVQLRVVPVIVPSHQLWSPGE